MVPAPAFGQFIRKPLVTLAELMNEKPPGGFWARAGAVVNHTVMADSRMAPRGVSWVFIMSGFRLRICGARRENAMRAGVENVADDVGRLTANSEIEN